MMVPIGSPPNFSRNRVRHTGVQCKEGSTFINLRYLVKFFPYNVSLASCPLPHPPPPLKKSINPLITYFLTQLRSSTCLLVEIMLGIKIYLLSMSSTRKNVNQMKILKSQFQIFYYRGRSRQQVINFLCC